MSIAEYYIKGLRDKIIRDCLWKGFIYGGQKTIEYENKGFELYHKIRKLRLEKAGGSLKELLKHDEKKNKERMTRIKNNLEIVMVSADRKGRAPKAKIKGNKIYQKSNKELLAELEYDSIENFFSEETKIIAQNKYILEAAKEFNQDFMNKYGHQLPEENIQQIEDNNTALPIGSSSA